VATTKPAPTWTRSPAIWSDSGSGQHSYDAALQGSGSRTSWRTPPDDTIDHNIHPGRGFNYLMRPRLLSSKDRGRTGHMGLQLHDLGFDFFVDGEQTWTTTQ